jgi:hypothetical protein
VVVQLGREVEPKMPAGKPALRGGRGKQVPHFVRDDRFLFFLRLEGLSGEDSSEAEARWSIGLMSQLKLRPPKEQRLLLAGRVR